MTTPYVPDLATTCTLNGLALDAGATVSGYELHADTRNTRQVTWRKQTVNNTWVEGDYDVSAVRGNVTEMLAVWVYAANQSDYRRRRNALADSLSMAAFPVVWTLDGMTETWDCTYSDYTEETQREFQYARQGLLRINLQRRPRVLITYSDASTYAG